MAAARAFRRDPGTSLGSSEAATSAAVMPARRPPQRVDGAYRCIFDRIKGARQRRLLHHHHAGKTVGVTDAQGVHQFMREGPLKSAEGHVRPNPGLAAKGDGDRLRRKVRKVVAPGYAAYWEEEWAASASQSVRTHST